MTIKNVAIVTGNILFIVLLPVLAMLGLALIMAKTKGKGFTTQSAWKDVASFLGN